ncbi:MAG: DUF1007 family protein [Pseudomonadota bacterium]
MTLRRLSDLTRVTVLAATASLFVPQVAVTHPHVFVDRGVDFVFEEEGKLSALNVTWKYDPFESLYPLSSLGVVPTEEGELTPGDRARLIHHESNWPEHFHGAAHLSVSVGAHPIGFEPMASAFGAHFKSAKAMGKLVYFQRLVRMNPGQS